MNRWVGVYVAGLLAAALLPVRAQDEDPVRAKLDKAKAAYEASMKKGRAAAAAWFAKREEAARKAGDKKAVDQIKGEREAFKDRGALPSDAPAGIRSQFAAARASLDAAYRAAIHDYTKAKQDAKASAVEREWASSLGGASRPPDAVKFRGKHYKAFDEKLTWHEAKKRCEELGGRLVVVKSTEENEFVAKLAAEGKTPVVWLGATDEKREGRWEGIDGSPLKYDHWDRAARQPNNAERVEHYAVLQTTKSGQWWDYPDDPKAHPKLTGAGLPGFVCQWD